MNIKNNNKTVFLLVVILFVGTMLRLLFLGNGPLLGDEPLYSVRSIGWIDTVTSDLQTTPVDWFVEQPWWTHLSFHDHPPLTFAVNFVFFKVFGYGWFMTRIPSAIFGILSIYLMFLIGRKLLNKKIGLLVAALFSVDAFVVHFSRVCMMESITLFFILLALYVFLHVLDNPRYLPVFGICLGLSFLAKYVAFAMIPVYLVMLLIYKREYFKNYRLYISILLCILVFSPVIIYNIEMYRAVGHFDLQFSYLFHQNTPEWKVLPGKEEIGSLADRLAGLAGVVYLYNLPIAILILVSLFYIFADVFINRKKLDQNRSVIFVVLWFLCSAIFLLKIGSAVRFLYYLVPSMLLSCAIFCWFVGAQIFGRLAVYFFIFLFFLEFIFSINVNLISVFRTPVGLPGITYLPQTFSDDYGIKNLDEYFDNELGGKMLYGLNSAPRKAFNVFVKRAQIVGENKKFEKIKAVLVYDYRVEIRTLNWIFFRRMLFGGWPIMNFMSLNSASVEHIPFLFDKDTNFYYVITTPNTARNYYKDIDKLPKQDDFLRGLLENGIKPLEIKNNAGLTVFWVYKFDGHVLSRVRNYE